MVNSEAKTPRERYRAQVRTEIKDRAWEQIATAGASALSLHAIAKQLGMSGPALQQELLRRRWTIPIVFITAHADEGIRPHVLEAGAVDCLFKPFSETALLGAVTTALRAS